MSLIAEAVIQLNAITKGEAPEVSDTRSHHDGTKIMPTRLLAPQIVTAEKDRDA